MQNSVTAGRVDRHRGGELAERQPVEEPLHVRDGVDRDAAVADLALGARVVGVEAHQRRHVEGDRQPVLPAVDEVVEALVGLDRVGEAGELPDRPRPRAVHRGVDAAGVGVLARVADALGSMVVTLWGRRAARAGCPTAS
jgi:hypothetical protein